MTLKQCNVIHFKPPKLLTDRECVVGMQTLAGDNVVRSSATPIPGGPRFESLGDGLGLWRLGLCRVGYGHHWTMLWTIALPASVQGA